MKRILFFLFFYSSLTISATYEFQRQLTVRVSLTTTPCYIDPSPLTVEFDNVQVNQLYNSANIMVPFTIMVEGCDATLASGVKFTFSGEEGSIAGTLKVPDPNPEADNVTGSKGFVIGINDDTGKRININQQSNLYTIKDNDNSFNFTAYLEAEPEFISSKKIVLGEFSATSSLVVSYE